MTPARLPGGHERIVLVGFMGAGKTTIGRQLAEILGWDFVDLDAVIAERAGRTIADIFRDDGEPAFRAAEHEAAAAASRRHEAVIATGGGAFVAPATREVLSNGALTVWLRCELPVLLERIGDGGGRPMAANRATISAILSEREPIYRLADLAVDTTHAAPRDTAQQIAAAAMRRAPGTK